MRMMPVLKWVLGYGLGGNQQAEIATTHSYALAINARSANLETVGLPAQS